MMSLAVSVCLSMGAFGGVGRGLVSLCLVLCVFMMSLAVSVLMFLAVSVCLSMGAWWGWARSCLSVSGVMVESWMERLIRFHNFDGLFDRF